LQVWGAGCILRKPMNYSIRAALQTDESFLWRMLYYAAHMDEDGAPPESARTNPDLNYYVENWMERAGDLGYIAQGPFGSALGAAWIRVMPAASPLYKYIATGTPELAVATMPEHVGRGLGSMLLECLLGNALITVPAVALSVRANNPARRLYERFGFEVVAELTNRVGTRSYVMATRPGGADG